jgi:hypothetical protein
MALWLKGPERGRRVDARTTKCPVHIGASWLDDCSAQAFPYNIFAYCSICRVDCKFARGKKKLPAILTAIIFIYQWAYARCVFMHSCWNGATHSATQLFASVLMTRTRNCLQRLPVRRHVSSSWQRSQNTKKYVLCKRTVYRPCLTRCANNYHLLAFAEVRTT